MTASLINDAGEADIHLRKIETTSLSPIVYKNQFRNAGVRPETLELLEKSPVGTCAEQDKTKALHQTKSCEKSRVKDRIGGDLCQPLTQYGICILIK